jgi:hypothetical protein
MKTKTLAAALFFRRALERAARNPGKKSLFAAALLLASAALATPALAQPPSFDVLATGIIPESTPDAPLELSHHIGVAVGPRFGGKLAIVPLINYTPYNAVNKSSLRFGVGLVYSIGPHIDFGLGEVQRPLLPRILAPAVMLGFKL